MPIYNKPLQPYFTMKKLEEITLEELEIFRKHRNLLEYTRADVAEIDNIVRFFINQHHTTCSSCNNSLRESKNMVNQFLATHGEKMQEYANKNAIESSIAAGRILPVNDENQESVVELLEKVDELVKSSQNPHKNRFKKKK